MPVLRLQPGADQIVEFSVAGTLREEALTNLAGVRGVRVRDDDRGGQESNQGAYALTVTDISLALPALLSELEEQGLRLVALTTHQATLEDVFVSLTGRMLRND